jgi:hypothetical protein
MEDEDELTSVLDGLKEGQTQYDEDDPDQRVEFVQDVKTEEGLFPISTLFEHVFGIKWNGCTKELVWDVFLTDRFGVQKFPLGMEGTANILCPQRENAQEKPNIQVTADMDFTLVLRWNGQEERISIHQ